MLKVLERLRTNRRQTEEQKAAAFESLAKRLAGGEEISESTIEATIHDAGCSIDELETAVETWRKRFGAAPLFAEEAKLREELPHTHDAMPKLDEELRQLTERVKAARQTAINRQTQIGGRLRAIGQAKHQLEESCRDRVALDRLRRARERLTPIQSQLQNWRSHLNVLDAATFSEGREIAEHDARRDSLSGPALQTADDRRAAVDRSLRAHESEAAELRKQIKSLAADEAAALRELGAAEAVVYSTEKGT